MFLGLFAGLLCIVGCSSLTDGQVRPVGKSCTLSDVTANNGEVFVSSLTGPCVKYFCDDSNILPNEYGCERDGKCFPLGDTYGVGCFERKCGPSNGGFHYELVKEGCEFNSTCLSVNNTVNDGCQKYQCTKEGDSWTATYSLQVIERGCERDDRCYPVGDSFISGCIRRDCTLENGRIGYSITSEACEYSNGTCVNVGKILQDGCTSYLCSKIVNSTLTTYSLDIHEEKCEDLNHQCRTPGSFFPYEISGVLEPNCTCTVFAGSGIGYSCF